MQRDSVLGLCGRSQSCKCRGQEMQPGAPMTNLAPSSPRTIHPRVGERRRLAVAGRLTWRDTNGALRFASVVTRDVSEADVFVECQGPASIPKYRLVHFQVERAA